MRFHADHLILAVLVAGSGYAVWTQAREDPLPVAAAAPRSALRIGERAGDFALKDIGGETRRLSTWKGAKATVLYFWSVECPCIGAVEHRVKDAMARFPESLGVRFIAIDSNPEDTAKQILAAMVEVRAEYRMLLDPEQTAAKMFGATQAVTFVVLDSDLKVRYRGALDDDVMKPKKAFLIPALDAVLAGSAADPAETKGEGCPYPGTEGDCPIQ